MKTICFYFQVHQPFRLRRYRFFDIGQEHYYYDDFANKSIMRKIAEKCYLPTNRILLDLINQNKGKFKVTFGISGTAIDQFERYAPEVLDSFRKLAQTGCVEFLAETYSHSLVSLRDADVFKEHVALHVKKIQDTFGYTPTVFRNTELIYSDYIGGLVSEMGFDTILTEGAKHILGWKSPNFIYNCASHPNLKLLLKNFKLSDDIAFRFSNKEWPEWPLTAEKYVTWLQALPESEKIINLFMDYETFGEHQWSETGIFEFLTALPKTIFKNTDFTFSTCSEVSKQYEPIAELHVMHPISWADEERDVSAWLGNEMQNEAFNKLYELTDRIRKIEDPQIQRDWEYLQTSDHFYYMCTKFFSDGDVHKYFNPFSSPYDAFINFMNILSDFIERVNKCHIPGEIEDTILDYERKIAELKAKMVPATPKAISGVKPQLKEISLKMEDHDALPEAINGNGEDSKTRKTSTKAAKSDSSEGAKKKVASKSKK